MIDDAAPKVLPVVTQRLPALLSTIFIVCPPPLPSRETACLDTL